MYLLVRTSNIHGKEVQDPEAEGANQGWTTEETESGVRYFFFTPDEYADLCASYPPEDPFNYMSIKSLAEIEEEEIPAILDAIAWFVVEREDAQREAQRTNA